jgi:hypothetical protein
VKGCGFTKINLGRSFCACATVLVAEEACILPPSYTAKPDRAAENETLSRAVFDQLRDAPPEGVAYALFRDGNEFIHVFLNLKEDESAPVTALPVFAAFQEGITDRCDVQPQATRLVVRLVDSYGFRDAS